MNPQFLRAYKFSLILLAGNIMLAIMFIAEWRFNSGSQERLTAILQQEHSTVSLFGKLPEDDTVLGVEGDYHTIIDQPLFIEGRQPVENSGNPQPQIAQNLVAPAAKPNLRLTGVVMIPDILVALLQDNKGKNYRVKQGETIQGWDVDSIQNDKITITNGTDRQDVLLREPKPVKRIPGLPADIASAMPVPPHPGMREGIPPPPAPPAQEYEESEPEPELEEDIELESEEQ
ncbi:MAG: hypothetical protein ACU837_01040 [Gammaproteobacteria bacterium]